MLLQRLHRADRHKMGARSGARQRHSSAWPSNWRRPIHARTRRCYAASLTVSFVPFGIITVPRAVHHCAQHILLCARCLLEQNRDAGSRRPYASRDPSRRTLRWQRLGICTRPHIDSGRLLASVAIGCETSSSSVERRGFLLRVVPSLFGTLSDLGSPPGRVTSSPAFRGRVLTMAE